MTERRREVEEDMILCQPCNESQHENIENVPPLPSQPTPTTPPTSPPPPIDTIPTFTPDYLETYTSIKALSFDHTTSDFSDFRLLDLRVEKDIKMLGERRIKQMVKAKKAC